MFNKVLVANRGVVAERVLRTLNAMGIGTVAVYSDADASLPYLELAGETFALGNSEPSSSYLNRELLLDIVKRSGADAVHPGYGFLSEDPGFATAVNESGAVFIGPSPRWLETMGHKTHARELMAEYGMQMSKSSGLLGRDDVEIVQAGRMVGYPVLVKPAGGGGGIGMLPAHNDAELLEAVQKSRSLAKRGFANDDVYLEPLVEQPRHVEFQILADRDGNVGHLFERDCSTQRRFQKVIEEAGAPKIPRPAVEAAAARICDILSRSGYDIIGTVETLYDGRDFNFLEMNTRLQVEHAVTEEVTGVDLVACQVRLAAGEKLNSVLRSTPALSGHAIEARIYAEDPRRFYPSPGRIKSLHLPAGVGVRVEFGYEQGNVVTPFYDSMLGMVIATAPTREDAINRLLAALHSTVIDGIKTNIPFICNVLQSPEFLRGDVHTGLGPIIIDRTKPQANS